MTDTATATSELTNALVTISHLTHAREPLVNRVRDFFLSKFTIGQIADYFDANEAAVEQLLYFGRANTATRVAKHITYDNLIIFANDMKNQGLLTPRDGEELSFLFGDIKKIQEIGNALVSLSTPPLDKKQIGLAIGNLFTDLGRLRTFVAILDRAPEFSKSLLRPPLRTEETLRITHELFSSVDINPGNLKALSLAINEANKEIAEAKKLDDAEQVLVSQECHTAPFFFYPPTPFMTKAVSDAIFKELQVERSAADSLAGVLLTDSPPYGEKLEALAASLGELADSELVTSIARTRPRDLGHIFDGTFQTTSGFGDLRTALQILTGRHNGILDQYDLLVHQANSLVIERPGTTPAFSTIPR